MKQTAVEWLYKNLLENPISNQDVEYNEAVFHNAKAMEKEQVINACEKFGNLNGVNQEDYERYYNDTYGK